MQRLGLLVALFWIGCGGGEAPPATHETPPPTTAAPASEIAPTPTPMPPQPPPPTSSTPTITPSRTAAPTATAPAPTAPAAPTEPLPVPGPLHDRASGGVVLRDGAGPDAAADVLRRPGAARVLATSGSRAALAAAFDGDDATIVSFDGPLVIDLALADDVETAALEVRGATAIGGVALIDGERVIGRADTATDGLARIPAHLGGGLVTLRIDAPARGPIQLAEIALVGAGDPGTALPPIDRLTTDDPAIAPTRYAPDRSAIPISGARSTDHLDVAMLALFHQDARVVGRIELRGRGSPSLTYAVVITAQPDQAAPPSPTDIGGGPLVENLPYLADATLDHAIGAMLGAEPAAPPPTTTTPPITDAAPVTPAGQLWRDSDCDMREHTWTQAMDPNRIWLVRFAWTANGEIDGIAGRLLTESVGVASHEIAVLDQDGDGWPELRLSLATFYTDGSEEADPCDAHASDWWVIDVSTALVETHLQTARGWIEAYDEDVLTGRASWGDDLDADGHRDVTLHLVHETGNPSSDDPDDRVTRSASVETYRYDPTTDTYGPWTPPPPATTAPPP